MTLYIRNANLADAAAIADLHVRAWQALYEGLIDKSYLENMDAQDRLKTWKENIKKTGKSYTVLVAELDGEVAGFATMGFAEDEQSDKAEMYSIYLDPALHGKGIGSALFRHSLAWARDLGFKCFAAWVFKFYLPGHEFYKRMGGRLISSSEKNLVIDDAPYSIVSYEWNLS